MSTLHRDRGRADADTGKGELRKPHDYSNQPGQGPSAEGGEDPAALADRGDGPDSEGGPGRDATAGTPREPKPPPADAARRRDAGSSAAGSRRS